MLQDLFLLVPLALSGWASPASSAPAPEPAPPQGQATIEWIDGKVLSATSASGATLENLGDSGVQLKGDAPDKDTWTIEVLSDVTPLTGVQIEFLADSSYPGGGPGLSGSGNLVMNEVVVYERSARGRRRDEAPLRYCSATYSQKGYAITRAMDQNPSTGWAIRPEFGRNHQTVFELAQSVQNPGGTVLVLELSFQYGAKHLPGKLRVRTTSSPDPARSVRTSQVDGELQAKIDNVIQKGVEYLLATQELDGSWADHVEGYPSGQTALSVFALAKSGLRAEHPAMRRALRYLEGHPPTKTYSAGCHLLALSALGRPEDETRMEELTDLLLSWKKEGGWAYPGGEIDISCTQFGALGLRAAAQYGIEVEDAIWEEMANDALHHHGEQETGPGNPRGFVYRPGGPVTGSRTTAGLTILAVAEEFLGKSFDRPWREAKEMGLAWLGRSFEASNNPKGGQSWLYYYLYGVERVGSMLQTTTIGGADWYLEGARFLVGAQKGDGSWVQSKPQADTCFALLFLTRGSGPTTGSNSLARRTYHAPAPKGGLELRAAGDTPLNVWLGGFGEELEKYVWPATDEVDEGFRVASVMYLGEEDELPAKESYWTYREREPNEDWRARDIKTNSWSEGPGSFGRPGTPGFAVRTAWEDEHLWVRRHFDYDPRRWNEPYLWLKLTEAEPQTLAVPASQWPLLALFDEQTDFHPKLNQGQGKLALEEADVFAGRRSIRASGKQKESPRIGGWSFPIVKKPKEGQYRYLHFAWKKLGDGGLMLQLANDGQWKSRLVAGKNSVGWEAESVARKAPRKWTTVTVDLYEAFGGDAKLTGLALTPMEGGDGLFDAIYLGSKKRDFKDIGAKPKKKRVIAASSKRIEEAALPNWVVCVNGQEVASGMGPLQGNERVAELTDYLEPGPNLISAHVRRLSEAGQAFDMGVRGRTILGQSEGDTDRPWQGERYPIRTTFRATGEQKVQAIATLLDKQERPVSIESDVLTVKINQALEPHLLGYASDSQRNELRKDQVAVTASSVFEGRAANALVDGRLSGGWLCSEGDEAPSVKLVLNRGVKARRVLLTATKTPSGARPFHLEVKVNGRSHEVEMDPDPKRKTVLDLGRSAKIRELEVYILDRLQNATRPAPVGFAEIELQAD